MSIVIATCGHTLTPEEGMGKLVCVREADNARSYRTVCLECYDWLKQHDLLLPLP